MVRYKIVPLTVSTDRTAAETVINELASEGWVVVCYTPLGIVMERISFDAACVKLSESVTWSIKDGDLN
jgi:hypothetical protein